ncbi:hypothetical protein CAEBREN_16676 [Caenorhabditis brenneri]|uniref:Uncharacterized protein n=1 Tax=Caenorhabditis brenneri TaxID=135651 RepID=G0M6W6_CAEBE|nr:hypothetical protein CAEBREN_16676 [Caenorhabditis brenneri]
MPFNFLALDYLGIQNVLEQLLSVKSWVSMIYVLGTYDDPKKVEELVKRIISIHCRPVSDMSYAWSEQSAEDVEFSLETCQKCIQLGSNQSFHKRPHFQLQRHKVDQCRTPDFYKSQAHKIQRN